MSSLASFRADINHMDETLTAYLASRSEFRALALEILGHIKCSVLEEENFGSTPIESLKALMLNTDTYVQLLDTNIGNTTTAFAQFLDSLPSDSKIRKEVVASYNTHCHDIEEIKAVLQDLKQVWLQS
jgi:hypothetical protein